MHLSGAPAPSADAAAARVVRTAADFIEAATDGETPHIVLNSHISFVSQAPDDHGLQMKAKALDITFSPAVQSIRVRALGVHQRLH